MGRTPCCEKIGLRKGRWTREEDEILTRYIQVHGEGSWRSLPKNAGLLRCGKSCRLRWINYLRADLKRGNITPEEHRLILRLHSSLGNRWSLIAGHLPGRTDNEIKNYWNTHVSKRNLVLTKRTATASSRRDRTPPTALGAAAMVGGNNTATATITANKKRKAGTSRFCMQKNALMSSSLRRSNNSTCPGRDGVDEAQTGPTVSLLVIKDQVESGGIHFSHVDNVSEGDELLGLGPDEWLDREMMRLDEFLLQDESIDLDKELEGIKHGKPTETERAVVTASYMEWHNNNNSPSSSVNYWFDWERMMRNNEASDHSSSPK
ncbi:hypothetical protein MLD38_036024 [Melastoma candidum]|uniref:Uncharacterized protein n=1 Tax=Melastoma candidum TaxID=119954 RepID=A0ACB9LIZ3_9MYRT|nr:hypothetical protein MLD38_036024 [Melastoma candidum]